EPLPEKVEGLYSGVYSREMLTRNVEAWQNLFNGTSREGVNGPGLDDYLNYLGTEFEPGMPLQEEINNRFDLVLNQTETLSPNLAEAVVNQQNQALEVFDEMQRVVVLLKVDMTSALGIQITYADNDGD
ncbi:MAG: peptidase M75 superfamily protein, partial [Flavobacteriales bacterium]|nr:peptidase M75 superfamily protein [Flavobacteriales bacterium]